MHRYLRITQCGQASFFMVRIQIPNNFLPERKYILNVIFKEFLGIEYDLSFSNDDPNYIITLPNGTILKIEDHFFSNLSNEEYISKSNMPNTMEEYQHECLYYPLPVLYGKPDVQYSGHSTKCAIDIFSSCFYMLTRWEEVAIDKRDDHGRFVATEALAVEHKFNHRPVVQEYVKLLKHMLIQLRYDGEFKNRAFLFSPTHDIDFPFKWTNKKEIAKTLLGDLVKRKSSLLFLKNIKRAYAGTDPYDSIAEIVKLSDDYNFTSRFYFLFDQRNSNKILEDEIRRKAKFVHNTGHETGLHPDLGTYINHSKMQQEYLKAKDICKQSIKHSRQHFLQFSVSDTFSVLESVGLETDSSLYFNDFPGFRTGSCWDFPVFDLKERKQLKVWEQTLCYMDTSFHRWDKPAHAQAEIFALIDQVKLYEGHFVFLWHNSSFDEAEWQNYIPLYDKVLKYAFSQTK